MQRLIIYSFRKKAMAFASAFLFLSSFFLYNCSDKGDGKEAKKESTEKTSLSDPQLQQMMDELNDSSEVNLADGFHELKYPNGKLKSTGTISNGKKEGLWTFLREDGTKWSECNFVNDVANGKVVSYHKNGQVNYIGYFSNGKKTGMWMFYDDKGKLLKEVNVNK